MFKKLLSALMALVLLLTMLFTPALAEDWRSQLLDAFGLEDDGSYDDDSWYYDDYDDAYYDEDYYDDDDDAYDEDVGAYGVYVEPEGPITAAQDIVNYLSAHNGQLPENFITKKEAQKAGWDSSSNYVGEVLPGMSIGGDRFGNYEGLLPDANGRQWYECDVEYGGKKRNAKRVLFSNDGLYYYTEDHYSTFTQMFPNY